MNAVCDLTLSQLAGGGREEKRKRLIRKSGCSGNCSGVFVS